MVYSVSKKTTATGRLYTRDISKLTRSAIESFELGYRVARAKFDFLLLACTVDVSSEPGVSGFRTSSGFFTLGHFWKGFQISFLGRYIIRKHRCLGYPKTVNSCVACRIRSSPTRGEMGICDLRGNAACPDFQTSMIWSQRGGVRILQSNSSARHLLMRALTNVFYLRLISSFKAQRNSKNCNISLE